MIFRAMYERKKITTQQDRYEKALEEQEVQEYSKLTLDEIQAKAMVHFDKFYNPDKDDVDLDLLAIILKRNCQIKIGHNKLYRLKKQIRFDHPDHFSKPDELNTETVKD